MRSLSICTYRLKVLSLISFGLISWTSFVCIAQELDPKGVSLQDPSITGLEAQGSTGLPAQGRTGLQARPETLSPTQDSLLLDPTNVGVSPAVPANNRTAPIASVKQTRVVLLKNDRCMTGRIRQLGDQVIIEIDESARIRQPASEIVTIADDLEGIYRYKVSRYAHLGPGEHIRLARWSMSNGLLQQASQHYLALQRDVGPDEPIVKQLGIELREHLLRDEDIRAYVGLPSLKQAAQKESLTEIRATSSAGSDTDALQPILPAVLNSFADNVQPILIKRCGQSGCHGLSSTNRFKLVQPGGTSRARISEQNCRSALQFIDVDSSNMSALVRYSVVGHGLQKSPPISSQETKLIDVIQSWTTFARNPVVAAVEQSQTKAEASASASGATAPAVYNAQSKNTVVPDTLKPVGPGAAQLRTVPQATATPTIIPGTGPVTRRELDELDDQIRKALGEPPRAQATDPFDPAEFNRLRAKK